MIAYLEGTFSYKNPAVIYVDVNGVGYEVNISLNTYSYVQDLKKGRLYTYLQVKEDSHTLFGFFDTIEKEMFILLIGVSGVGASTARMMLSSMKPEEISNAIMRGDARLLESVKGIGRKTAERLVLELRDKVGKQSFDVNIAKLHINTIEQDALNALMALGISKPIGEAAIKKVMAAEPETEQLELLIKKSLKAI